MLILQKLFGRFSFDWLVDALIDWSFAFIWSLNEFENNFSFLSGLCYSELCTRFPLGGSAYVFAYATLGEFPAFLLGWAMHLEYSFAGALAALTALDYIHAFFDPPPLPPSSLPSSLTILSNSSGHSMLTSDQVNVQGHPTHLSASSSANIWTSVALLGCFSLIISLRIRGSKVSLERHQKEWF